MAFIWKNHRYCATCGDITIPWGMGREYREDPHHEQTSRQERRVEVYSKYTHAARPELLTPASARAVTSDDFGLTRQTSNQDSLEVGGREKADRPGNFRRRISSVGEKTKAMLKSTSGKLTPKNKETALTLADKPDLCDLCHQKPATVTRSPLILELLQKGKPQTPRFPEDNQPLALPEREEPLHAGPVPENPVPWLDEEYGYF
ncbi:hypothetical protein M011DRAFT_457218 [Sporormia fimetaria CBS 119925]|uniref:Uncharacterized protein n=1 Tax=Sporormia fimetaria CBS 119925 TaxID=1340428 RepID=A0A6A6VHW9_9PLEO|nr:hypothetical protein M011DRAFT_457218 [Sporormia fimetaria CBS 119925]